MKLSLKNMGWSCVFLESNQLGYSFNFCSTKFYLFQQGKKTSQFPAYEEASNFPVTEVLPLSSYAVPESSRDDNHVFFAEYLK